MLDLFEAWLIDKQKTGVQKVLVTVFPAYIAVFRKTPKLFGEPSVKRCCPIFQNVWPGAKETNNVFSVYYDSEKFD